MDKILHHLVWLKPYKLLGDSHHPWWCRILSINSINVNPPYFDDTIPTRKKNMRFWWNFLAWRCDLLTKLCQVQAAGVPPNRIVIGGCWLTDLLLWNLDLSGTKSNMITQGIRLTFLKSPNLFLKRKRLFLFFQHNKHCWRKKRKSSFSRNMSFWDSSNFPMNGNGNILDLCWIYPSPRIQSWETKV